MLRCLLITLLITLLTVIDNLNCQQSVNMFSTTYYQLINKVVNNLSGKVTK